MQLISRITIDRFRSIAHAKLETCGHFTALAGLNNSGKSNILRALNAFFSGETDQGKYLSIEDDYHRQYFKRKKAKKIRISVAFQLPDQFTFRKDLRLVQDYLGGKNFEISKEWTRGRNEADYFLNDDGPLQPNERGKLDQFLGLISFRYIPNRVPFSFKIPILDRTDNVALVGAAKLKLDLISFLRLGVFQQEVESASFRLVSLSTSDLHLTEPEKHGVFHQLVLNPSF